jgi:heme exporter protein A
MNAGGPFQDQQGVRPNIRVEALTLARGSRLLFENLSFNANAGGYLELRGPNGVGKTSLLRVIGGYLKPRAGRVVFAGVEEPAVALHYVGHLNGLKGASSVRAHVRYWAGLLGGSSLLVDEALEEVGLTQQADLPARVLSQGQARRLALARLVIAPRPIWLLDEPAAALDSEARIMVGKLVETHCANGGVALAAVHEALGPAPAQTLALSAA